MNPINDEIPAKDSTDVEESNEALREIKLVEVSEGNEKKINEDLKEAPIEGRHSEDQKETQDKLSENDHHNQTESTKNDHSLEAEAVANNQLDSRMERETINENETKNEGTAINKVVNENACGSDSETKIFNENAEDAESKESKTEIVNEKENSCESALKESKSEIVNEKENSCETDSKESKTEIINEKENDSRESKTEIVSENSCANDSKESKLATKTAKEQENMKIIAESSAKETDLEANKNSTASSNVSETENIEKNPESLDIESSKAVKETDLEGHSFNENSSVTEEENEKNESEKKENMKKNLDESSALESSKTLETDSEEANDFEDDVNKETSIVSEPATEDEGEEFEDVEDVEIPDEQEFDEIIVPDEAEAEDLTDGKDQDVEMYKSQNGEAEGDEEEHSSKESDAEDDENELNPNETEEETAKSDEDDEGESEKNESANIGEKDEDEGDTDSKGGYAEAEELVEIPNVETCVEKSNAQPSNLDEDTTTQASSYDPLNCTDDNNKEAEGEAEDGDGDDQLNLSQKNVENSNESQSLEKDQNEEAASSQNIESDNENSVECESQKKAENEENKEDEDDDDDEVQFVETRNSPICIESDDEDDVATTPTNNNNNNEKNDNNKRVITTATTTVSVPLNITVTRTSARKSTAKPPQLQFRASKSTAAAASVPQFQQNRTKKGFSYVQKSSTQQTNKRAFTGTSTQKIVDCIELLDSSDEEFASKNRRTQQQQRTPQKRTLLAAKGNFYKNNNNSKQQMTPAVNRLPHNFTPQIRQQPKKPAPPPLPPPTPQSNFLNAVQLQPASVTGANPPAFSALLSNKNVIIPNAFYGNPPSIREASSSEAEIEKRTTRWLENFLNQFCKPQFEPTHSCYVFLQRALKYKDFVRIKSLRSSMMNSHVQNANNQLNIELMSDLKTIFFKNVRKPTNYGQRFCELTCTAAAGKSVTLITHRLSGKVTLKTCNMEFPKTANSNPTSNASTSSYGTSTTTTTSTNSTTRKRQLDEDEDEYTPDKSLYKTKVARPPSENGDEDSGDTGGEDRKRSLRTKRTKRIDNSFSYNEDDLLAEYEIEDEDDEKLAQVEIQRKIEQKRLEAQKQRQQQVKSFESAFIQAFAKSIDGPTTSTKSKTNASNQRIRLKNTPTSTVTTIREYTANNDAEDLLQATWIENLENDNTHIISDDDEPQEHRIYKQQQEELQQAIRKQQQNYQYKLPSNLTTIDKISNTTHASGKHTGRATKRTASSRIQEEFITGDDNYEENNYYANNSMNDNQPLYWPKNTDAQMTVNGKSKDRCVICSLNCQRLVHHYVNEHRGCETYNSRLSNTQIKKLKQGNCTASVSLYKNGQNLYEAFCIFCNKVSRFMLRYWYQHYTMHTGEYAYRCTGCGIRKPTQSLLTLHHSQGCPGNEVGIVQDFTYDAKSLQIEAKICSICNYVQLHRSNLVKHLHTQHNITQILPKYIITVVLMKIPANPEATTSSSPPNKSRRSLNTRSSSAAAAAAATTTYSSSDTFVIEDVDNNDENYEEILPEDSQSQIPPLHYYNYIPPYMQAAFNSGNLSFVDTVDAGEDLSFTICDMLDVHMNANEENN